MSAQVEDKATDPTAPTAKTTGVPRLRPLSETQFKLATFVTNRWAVVLPREVDYARVFDPEFWSNVSHRMSPSDIIEVHSEGKEFYAELYVLQAKRLSAVMYELCKIALDSKIEAPKIDNLTVRHMGPMRQYCIMRGKDVVAEGFVREADAIAAIGARAKEAAR